MNSAGLEKVEEIFYAAISKTPQARRAFVARACGSDRELKSRVELLVACYPSVGDFIQSPVADLATSVLEHIETQSFVGRRMAHYELIERIGSGGMGDVYLAQDVVAGRKAAIKLLPMRFTGDAARVQRFAQEARAVVALNHPHIITIYEIGQDIDTHYIASELIEGETLRRRLAHGPIPLDEAVEITRQIASALAAAHEAGIIHRDIKPENIMLRRDGYVKVLDFGIAKLSEQVVAPAIVGEEPQALARTLFGSAVGTLSYMSPEQARGGMITAAADIWSLGVVLSEMLGIDETTSGQPECLQGRSPLPGEIERLLGRMLAREPDQRYANGAALVEALKCLGKTRALAPQRRMTRMFALTATVTTLLLVGLTIYLLRRQTPDSLPAKSIAVLPFENLSDNKTDRYFAIGVQDEILSNLAKISDLKVVSRTSTSSYLPGKSRNSHAIGADLGVAYLLEGNLQRHERHLRVNAQLIDTRNDSHRWAKTYDRDISDIFSIQSEIAQTIATELESNISEREKASIARPATTDLVAQDLYAKAMSLASQSTDDNVEAEEISLLEQAIARDPRFVRAYCLLARLHLDLYVHGADHIPARLEKARTAIETAAQIQPEAGEVHLARAHYLSRGLRQYDEARAELELARRTLPNEAVLYDEVALMDRRQGRWSEALGNYNRAIQLDPLNARYLEDMGDTEVIVHHYAAARQCYQRLLSVSPRNEQVRIALADVAMQERADTAPLHATLDALVAEDPAAASKFAEELWVCAILRRDLLAAERALEFLPSIGHGYGGAICPKEWNVAFTASLLSQPERARAALTEASALLEKHLLERPDDGLGWSLLGKIRAMLNDKQAAVQAGQRACQIWPVSREPAWGLQVARQLAQIYALLGEKDLALQQLQLYADQLPFLNYGELKLRPEWDQLRGDPRFEKLVASLAPQKNSN